MRFKLSGMFRYEEACMLIRFITQYLENPTEHNIVAAKDTLKDLQVVLDEYKAFNDDMIAGLNKIIEERLG